MAVDKDLLFEPMFDEDDFEIPGRGSIRVRGLSSAEVHKIKDEPPKKAECMIVAMASVDPLLTEEEAARLQRKWSAGLWKRLVEQVQRLSGLADGAAKSDVPAVRE